MRYFNWTKKQKVDMARTLLSSAGYEFKHPTLVLEGADGWFLILTPKRSPYQMLVHVDEQDKSDFFTTLPELIS